MVKRFVFISYRRADEKSALLLHQGLAAAFGDRKAWLDHENIEGGTEWMGSIANAVGACSAFVVLIGKGWAHPDNLARLRQDGDVVRAEIEQALARRADPKDNLPILPILFDGVRMPSKEDLPASLVPLLRIDAPDVRDDKFVRDLNTDIVPQLEKSIGPTLTYESPRQRRWRLIWFYAKLATLLLVMLVAAVGGYAAWEYAGVDPDNLFQPGVMDLLTDYIEPWEYGGLAAGVLVVFFGIVLLIRRRDGPSRYRLVRDATGQAERA